MTARISGRARAVHASPTLALAAKAKARRDAGEDIVSFGAGEPDFDTPRRIKEAAVRALEMGRTKYTATAGLRELREVIRARMVRDGGLDYSTEEILVSCGAKQSLYNVFQAVLDSGDEAVICAPYWVSYPEMARLAGATPVVVPCREEDGFQLVPEALARALSPRTRLVVLNSPNNPTGAVLSRERLAALAGVLADWPDVWIASDDIYERLLYTGGRFATIAAVAPALRDRTVVVSGVSKTYAMTGWRIGYAAGPAEIIAAMGRIQDQTTSGPTTFAQWGALAALSADPDDVEPMRAEFDRRRRRMLELLAAIPGITCVPPEGAFYTFPNVGRLLGKRYGGSFVESSVGLCDVLLERGVAAVPGEPFGAPGYLRLSFALGSADMEKGLARIAKLVADLA